jgi:hypothetical protein
MKKSDWLSLIEHRDTNGLLTPLTLALSVIGDAGCDCGTDEPGTCLGCICEEALKYLVTKLEASEAEVARLKSEFCALQVEAAYLQEHTWEQERAAVVEWLRDTIYGPHLHDLQRDYLAERIQSGAHWPTERRI